MQALNPLEGAVLSLTRHILGSRRARLTFIAYIAALHAFVMLTTYECMLSPQSAVARVHSPTNNK